jgi:hypothetical protein
MGKDRFLNGAHNQALNEGSAKVAACPPAKQREVRTEAHESRVTSDQMPQHSTAHMVAQ